MRRLLTPGWLACHVLMVVLVVGMLGLAGWQLSRAAGGNGLSWGYTFQWPAFAGFVVFVWAREVRRVVRSAANAGEAVVRPTAPAASTGGPAAAAVRSPVVTRRPANERAFDDADDPRLAAYNRYLAWLRANPGARPVDYPG